MNLEAGQLPFTDFGKVPIADTRGSELVGSCAAFADSHDGQLNGSLNERSSMVQQLICFRHFDR